MSSPFMTNVYGGNANVINKEDVSGPVSEYSNISFWTFIVTFDYDIANQLYVLYKV